MKILIIDRDDSAANLVKVRLEQGGHKVTVSAAKADAVDQLATNPVDAVFVDPAPLADARQLILNIRRRLPTYTYIVLMGTDLKNSDAFATGANAALPKPFVPQQVTDAADAAGRLQGILRNLNNTAEDFPSGGGVIAKSAFCQLFLSAIERADRYTEQAFAIFISLRNYNQIKVLDTEYAADTAAAMLARQLARMRRQSDILAQTGAQEYALLLQRPNYPNEPVDAAMRFADTLSRNRELMASTRAKVEVLVSLVEIPSGMLIASHEVVIGDEAATG